VHGPGSHPPRNASHTTPPSNATHNVKPTTTSQRLICRLGTWSLLGRPQDVALSQRKRILSFHLGLRYRRRSLAPP
jgi:hypothetical protein